MVFYYQYLLHSKSYSILFYLAFCETLWSPQGSSKYQVQWKTVSRCAASNPRRLRKMQRNTMITFPSNRLRAFLWFQRHLENGRQSLQEKTNKQKKLWQGYILFNTLTQDLSCLAVWVVFLVLLLYILLVWHCLAEISQTSCPTKPRYIYPLNMVETTMAQRQKLNRRLQMRMLEVSLWPQFFFMCTDLFVHMERLVLPLDLGPS